MSHPLCCVVCVLLMCVMTTAEASRNQNSRAIGIVVKTNEEFHKAMLFADTFDGLCLIQCELDREDSTEELIRFGKKVSKSNGRVGTVAK